MTEDKNHIATSYDWWSHAGSVSPMPPKIMLGSGREPVMTIHPDGKITLGENAQPTEAAAECINAMSHMIQSMIDRAVAAERAAIVAWLRERDGLEDCYSELKGDWLSNRIEEGEHLK